MDDWDNLEDEDYMVASSPSPPSIVITPPPPTTTTLVLVGKTGNGKSATGNSILGWRGFASKKSFKPITKTCEVQSVSRPDGRCIRVIDTPGLFDVAANPEFVGKEIARCIDLAKDGIHGLLLVLTLNSRFTNEEAITIESLRMIFGQKVFDYMVIVFTGGDGLGDDETLETYLNDAPEFVQKFVGKCGNRTVLFDNATKDSFKRERQVANLLKVVDDMVTANSRIPYSNDYFEQAKRIQESADEHVKDHSSLIERRFREFEEGLDAKVQKVKASLLQQMEERLSEERKRAAESEARMQKLQEQLEKAEKKSRQELDEAKKEATKRLEDAKREAAEQIKKVQREAERAAKEEREKMAQEIAEKSKSWKCSIL